MIGAWLERAQNLAAALRRRTTDDARMHWSRDQLAAFQRAQLRALVRHATEHSPFYRETYGGVIDRDVDLAELPPLDKATMMERFDDVVTDRRLRRAELEAHVAQLAGDERYLGEFRVMASSGSSGRKGIYVYDRAAWRGGFMTASLRMAQVLDMRPRLPRMRLATIAAGDGKHMTFRGGASMDVGVYVTHRIAASAPLADQVAELTAFRPDVILGYPSVLALLAEEQRAGRLAIRPRAIATSSEVRTPAMTAAIERAWQVAPHDCLGLTELGITAVDCDRHAGLHLFEDLCIVEVVDEANRPVPAGTVGAKVLVTNLYNRAQPIIRFEVGDHIAIDPAPCACGKTLARIVSLEGRSDDMLVLPGRRGPVRIHPIHVRGPLAAEASVLQYQVVHRGAELDVACILARDAPPGTLDRVARTLTDALRARDAEVAIAVRAVTEMPRSGAGKLALVRSEPFAPVGATPGKTWI